MSAYRDLIRFIQDGEAVAAGVTNRPTADVQGNVAYLRDRMNAADLGEALFALARPAAPGVLVGQPVYWDAARGRFDLALAAIALDPATGSIAARPSSFVRGICSAAYHSGIIDVCTLGAAPIPLAAAVAGDVTPGQYYLSPQVPGRLIRQSPSVSIPVLFAAGDGFAYVQPQVRNFLNDHAHYTFELACRPAGTTAPPSGGARHAITAPDPTQAGWLPAGHASFGGAAPLGAAWGYNLARHPELAAVWPPLPAGGAVLFWDKGLDPAVGGTLIPLGTAGGLVVVDADGIWWMSDCNGDVPWPATWDSAAPPGPPADDASPPACPRPVAMRLVLGYYVSLFASRSALVTSLRAAPGSPVLVTDLAGHAATAGDLAVGFDWAATVAPGDVDGAEVLKTIAGGVFSKGFVLEGLQVSGAGLAVTATRVGTRGGNPLYQGVVQIASTLGAVIQEVTPDVVRLQDAAERTFTNPPYTGLPADRASSILLRYELPPAGLSNSPTAQLKVTFYGVGAGTVPAVSAAYRRVTGTSGVVPASDTALALTTGQSLAAGGFLQATTNTFPVAPGDTVLITLGRAGNDGYNVELGLLRYGLILS